MKNYRKIKNAFSLIELSIVILIVGILVAGVTSSSRLIKRMKITVAQNLTQSSPVPSIKDLSVWYESSMDKILLMLKNLMEHQLPLGLTIIFNRHLNMILNKLQLPISQNIVKE